MPDHLPDGVEVTGGLERERGGGVAQFVRAHGPDPSGDAGGTKVRPHILAVEPTPGGVEEDDAVLVGALVYHLLRLDLLQ